jgi:hypothetical protein
MSALRDWEILTFGFRLPSSLSVLEDGDVKEASDAAVNTSRVYTMPLVSVTLQISVGRGIQIILNWT